MTGWFAAVSPIGVVLREAVTGLGYELIEMRLTGGRGRRCTMTALAVVLSVLIALGCPRRCDVVGRNQRVHVLAGNRPGVRAAGYSAHSGDNVRGLPGGVAVPLVRRRCGRTELDPVAASTVGRRGLSGERARAMRGCWARSPRTWC